MIPNRTPSRKPRPDVVYPFHPFAPLPAQKSEKWERERFPGFVAHGILFRIEEGEKEQGSIRMPNNNRPPARDPEIKIPTSWWSDSHQALCVFANRDECSRFPPILCHEPEPCLRSSSKQNSGSHHYAKLGRWKTHPGWIAQRNFNQSDISKEFLHMRQDFLGGFFSSWAGSWQYSHPPLTT